MLYLQTKTILIELITLKTKPVSYLIGDSELPHVPTTIIQSSFKNANWNRALKYLVSPSLVKKHQTLIEKKSYFPLHLNLYLSFNPTKLVLLGFDPFGQAILDQVFFHEHFLPLIAKNYQKQVKQTILFDEKKLAEKYLTLNHQPPQKIDRFIVHQQFNLNNAHYQWKVLIQLGAETKVSFTNHHQVIYTVDQTKITSPLLEQAWMINPTSGMVYFQGRVQIQDQLTLNLDCCYEDLPLTNQLYEAVISELGQVIPEGDLTYFHHYNLTNDTQYLVAFLEEHLELDYFHWKALCDEIFQITKQSYYELFYSLEQTKPYLWAKVTNLNEWEDFVVNSRRFGFSTLLEEEKIQQLKDELTISK